jgi:hypothetical protein
MKGADQQPQGADQREGRSGLARRLSGLLGLLSRLLRTLQHGIDTRFRVFGVSPVRAATGFSR